MARLSLQSRVRRATRISAHGSLTTLNGCRTSSLRKRMTRPAGSFPRLGLGVVGVLGPEMSSGARLTVSPPPTSTSFSISRSRGHDHVIHVQTGSYIAEMVNHHAIRDRPFHRLPRHAMRVHLLAIQVDPRVPLTIRLPGPEDARIHAGTVHQAGHDLRGWF